VFWTGGVLAAGRDEAYAVTLVLERIAVGIGQSLPAIVLTSVLRSWSDPFHQTQYRCY
jgi:hypothetical protein